MGDVSCAGSEVGTDLLAEAWRKPLVTGGGLAEVSNGILIKAGSGQEHFLFSPDENQDQFHLEVLWVNLSWPLLRRRRR